MWHGELGSGRVGDLAILVVPPTLHTVAGRDAAGVVAPSAHTPEGPGRRGGLAVGLFSPTLHSVVGRDSAGVTAPSAHTLEGAGWRVRDLAVVLARIIVDSPTLHKASRCGDAASM